MDAAENGSVRHFVFAGGQIDNESGAVVNVGMRTAKEGGDRGKGERKSL